MFKQVVAIIIGTIICTLAAAQPIESRVLDLERRVEQLEKQVTQSASPESSSKPRSSQSWRSLKREMTEKQVRSILGEPDRVQATAQYTAWEYPGDGEALFSPNGLLRAWSEPR
jgi:hypothetical protein